MTKLKLASIDDDKPVKLTVTLPAALAPKFGRLCGDSREGNGQDRRAGKTHRADAGEVYRK